MKLNDLPTCLAAQYQVLTEVRPKGTKEKSADYLLDGAAKVAVKMRIEYYTSGWGCNFFSSPKAEVVICAQSADSVTAIRKVVDAFFRPPRQTSPFGRVEVKEKVEAIPESRVPFASEKSL